MPQLSGANTEGTRNSQSTSSQQQDSPTSKQGENSTSRAEHHTHSSQHEPHTHASAESIDLSAEQHCDCLSSAKLAAIKNHFKDTLPDTDTMSSYASYLRQLSADVAGKPTKPNAATKEAKHEEASLVDTVTSTLQSFDITKVKDVVVDSITSSVEYLKKNLFSSVADIVESVVETKRRIAEETITEEELHKEIDELRLRMQQAQKQLEELRRQNPEAAKAAEPHLNAYIKQTNEFIELMEQSHKELNEQSKIAERHNEHELVDSIDAERQALREQHVCRIEVINGVTTRICETLLDPKSSVEEKNAASADAIAAIRKEADAEHDDGKERRHRLIEAAKLTGNSSLIREFVTYTARADIAAREAFHRLNRTLDAWESAYQDGWQRGLSLDHYLANTESYFAAASNQYDLAYLKQIQATRKLQYVSEASSSRNVEPSEAVGERATKHTPEGFKVLVWFNELARKFIHHSFEEEGLRRDRESQERQQLKARLERLDGNAPPTDIHGTVATHDRLRTVRGKLSN